MIKRRGMLLGGGGGGGGVVGGVFNKLHNDIGIDLICVTKLNLYSTI